VVVTPEMVKTPPLLDFVRERLHEEVVERYPQVPFSKRFTPAATERAQEVQVQRTNRLQMNAMRTVVRAQAALPLLQNTQLQASRFGSFSASASRFGSFSASASRFQSYSAYRSQPFSASTYRSRFSRFV
jgi:hypothetical protein